MDGDTSPAGRGSSATRADRRRLELKAPPADQLRLLDVQTYDTRLDQLAHRRRSLPEIAELQRLGSDLQRDRDLLVAAEAERSDIERARVKAEGDVEQVRQRATRDQRRLDAGQVSAPKELQNLQSEIASLGRRQSELEDVELAVMERLEDVDQRVAALTADRDRLTDEIGAVTARRDAAFMEIDDEAALTGRARAAAVASVGGELVALYEKVRAQSDGIGAAPLRHRRCQGCRLEVNNVDMGRFRAAADDEVLRCEECRRILVRTAESGL